MHYFVVLSKPRWPKNNILHCIKVVIMKEQQLSEYKNTIKSNIEAYIEKGEIEIAKELIRQYETLVQKDSDIYSLRSIIAFIENKLDKSEYIAKLALILNPTNPDFLYNYSTILGRINRKSEQIFFLQKALSYTKEQVQQETMKKELAELETLYQNGSIESQNNIDFITNLLFEIYRNIENDFYFNIDIELLQYMNIPIDDIILVNYIKERESIVDNIDGLLYAYEQLESSSSKDLFIRLLTYRILSNKKVKLPLNNHEYWTQRKSINSLVSEDSNIIISPFHNWKLKKFNLKIGERDIGIFYTPMGVSATFFDKQYEYNQGQVRIKAEEGNCVIDCGGCWGDTALYFANEVGENGSVFSLEFIPSNLSILKKNLEINQELERRIKIIENPVWNSSNERLYFKDQGPASIVTNQPDEYITGEVDTISIDDLVLRNSLNKVDFIKMDIEGAELNALQGAINTIKKFTPSLAIAVYHNINDIYDVIHFIKEQNPHYSFYLGHYTIYAQETVLFAKPLLG